MTYAAPAPLQAPLAPGPAPAKAEPFRLGYQPALDGLRGLAAAAIVTYHAVGVVLPGGYISVDVFFVLSGFLITSLLIDEGRRNGRLRLAHFYLRRAFRLVPAMAVVLVVVTAADVAASLGRHWSLQQGISILDTTLYSLLQAAAAAFYVTDLVVAFDIDELLLVRHTWSLAVEERFYLLWPPLVALLLRRKSYQFGFWVCAALASVLTIGRGLAFFVFDIDRERLYFGFDARADALLVGCGLAFAAAAGLHHRIPGRVVRWLTWAAVALFAIVLATPSRWDAPFMQMGPLVAVSLAAAVIIGRISLLPWAPLVKWLSNGPLVAVGKLSYGLYLWHYPILGAFWYYAPWISPLVAVVLSFLAAKASYELIERRALAYSNARFRV